MSKSEDSYHQSGQLLDEASCDEDLEVPVSQLSGDQGAQKSIVLTHRNQAKANMFFTIITVIKSIIGSGILNVPYTVSIMGWALSLILFLLAGLANQYSIYILLKAKNLSKHSSYNSIAFSIYRPKLFRFFISSIILFGNLGFCVSMLSFLKGMFRKVIQMIVEDQKILGSFYTTQWFITLIVALFLVPAMLVKKLQSLKHTAIAGVIGVLVANLAVFIIFFQQMGERNWTNNFTMRAFPEDFLSAISAVPNIIFVLVYHMSLFSIHKGLKGATDKRTNIANSIGGGFCVVLYIIVGMMWYCLYGDQQMDVNMLLMLNIDKISPILLISGYLGHFVSICFCLPIMFFVARNNFIAIVKMYWVQNQTPQTIRSDFKNTIQQIGSFMKIQNKQERQKAANKRFYIYSLGLFALVVIITITVQSIKVILNLVGAIASTSIGFVFPFMFYVLLIRKKRKNKKLNYFICMAGLITFVPLGVLAIISLYI